MIEMGTIWEIIIEAIADSVKMLPFLFLAYLFIEWLEQRGSEKINEKLHTAGKYGSVAGALLGCIPQCGFSVAAAKLYSAGVITLGTLVAVFISTSDEALPVLFANPDHFATVWKLLLCKILIGIIAGFTIDFLLRKQKKTVGEEQDIRDEADAVIQEGDSCCKAQSFFRQACVHTVQTFLFILAVCIAFNFVLSLIGPQQLSDFLASGTVWQPMLAAFFGFIPNCAVSVILTELYISGGISFGAALAGLCTGAGVGLAVLYKNRNVKQTLRICVLLYLIAVLSGILANLVF